jgi:hypothetical protein
MHYKVQSRLLPGSNCYQKEGTGPFFRYQLPYLLL